jgi:ROK family protein (putative glucokinase)
MKAYGFGIDVGGTTIKCGFFDLEGNLLDKWEIVTRTMEKGKYILSDIADTITAKMKEKSLKKEQILGVGVGVPGPVNEAGEVLCAVNLFWENVQIERDLEHLLDLPIKAGNDANVAALGEMWKGGGIGYQNLVMITLGTGIGGGVIYNGHIVTGSNGSAGEIGHIHVENNLENDCNCGKRGCLEQVASATGIAKLARDILHTENGQSCLQKKDIITAKDVFDAVKAGDLIAIKIAEKFGEYLGKALANIAVIIDPQVFVIGGGVSKAGSILLEYIEKYYNSYIFRGCQNTKFSLAKLGNDAGIYGAVKLIMST